MAEHLEDSGLEQHTLYLKRLGAYGVDHFPACHSTTQGKLSTVDSRRNLVSSWFVLRKYLFHQYFRIQGRRGIRIKTSSKGACSWPVADREGDKFYLFSAFQSGPFS